MPYNQVMSKFQAGKLHSGSANGPQVKNRAQAVAIMLSEKAKADSGDREMMAAPVADMLKKRKKAKSMPKMMA